MKTILVMDDDELILESVYYIFSDLGFEVTTSSIPEQGVALAKSKDFDLILTDIRMPGMNGAQVVEEIMRAKKEARILVVTAYPADPWVQQAIQAGALGIMKKPFEIAKILEFLKNS